MLTLNQFQSIMYSTKIKDFEKNRGEFMIFKRDRYLNQLINKKNNSLIKVITGARRSGKSFLLNTIFYEYLLDNGVKEKKIIKFSFDNDEDVDLLDAFFPEEPTRIHLKNGLYTVNSKKFRAYIKSVTNSKDMFYLLLDEIQILDSFVGTLNGFLDHDNFDVYVTGSNSQLLSSEIETKFRGRKSSVHVLPLSFSELLTGINKNVNDAWKDYVVYGGIPIVYKQVDEDRIGYLTDLCREVYLKDIVGRKGVKDEEGLFELFGLFESLPIIAMSGMSVIIAISGIIVMVVIIAHESGRNQTPVSL